MGGRNMNVTAGRGPRVIVSRRWNMESDIKICRVGAGSRESLGGGEGEGELYQNRAITALPRTLNPSLPRKKEG